MTKSPFLLWGVGALTISLLTGCTVALGPQAVAKGHLIVGAPRAASEAHGLVRSPWHRFPGKLPSNKTRDLSAATDIQSMSYSIVNQDPNSGEPPLTDWMDPSWPYVEAYLTAGATYSISVDVTPTAQAPGVASGVTKYGDEVVVTMPSDGSDKWVDLFVRPTWAVVFDPQIDPVTGAITAWNEDTGLSRAGLQATPVSGLSVSSGDRFFYAPNGNLYYFNQSLNAVFRWRDLATPLDLGTPVLKASGAIKPDGTPLGNKVQLLTVCPDPVSPNSLWGVIRDASEAPSTYSTVWFDLSPTTPEAWVSTDLTTTVESGLTSPTVTVTGVTADVLGDVFVSYVAEDGQSLFSGVADCYSANIWGVLPAQTQFLGSSSSLFTDVLFSQGRLYVLVSPNTSRGPTSLNNQGTADLWTFDDTFVPLGTQPTSVSQVYSAARPIPSQWTGETLVMPARFALNPIGGDFLVGQWDIAQGSPTKRFWSIVSPDQGTVTAYP